MGRPLSVISVWCMVPVHEAHRNLISVFGTFVGYSYEDIILLSGMCLAVTVSVMIECTTGVQTVQDQSSREKKCAQWDKTGTACCLGIQNQIVLTCMRDTLLGCNAGLIYLFRNKKQESGLRRTII